MHFEAKYAGKWVAVRGEKVIDSSKSIKKLLRKVGGKEQARSSNIRFSLVPKGCMAGFQYGF